MNNNYNLWPMGIVTAFVLFFCGLTSVIVIAITHGESLVSDSYYEQELNFQSQIDSAARAQKAGASISRDPVNGTIVITLPASHLANKFSGSIVLYRPSDPGLDQQLELKPNADGTQMLDVSKLASGLWRVTAEWKASGDTYFLQQKFTVIGK